LRDAKFELNDDGNRCLGLIGGLGVGSTVHYYRALAKAHDQLEKPLRLLIAHADVRRVLGHVQANRLEDLTEYLAALIGQLKDGGANLAAVAAVTPHIAFGELLPRSSLPLVNLLEVARDSILGKRIALFGTRFTMETDLFGALTAETTIRPQPDEMRQIHEIYTRTALSGEGLEEDRQALTFLARTLMRREDLEAIVFAGTDLALLFDKSNTPFPVIDCAGLHLDAIMKQLLA
jgi:aspartate racemase